MSSFSALAEKKEEDASKAQNSARNSGPVTETRNSEEPEMEVINLPDASHSSEQEVVEPNLNLEDCYLCYDCGSKLLVSSDRLAEHCEEFRDHDDIVPVCVFNKFSIKLKKISNTKRPGDPVVVELSFKRPRLD